MNEPPFSFPEILARLDKALQTLFWNYRISKEDAERILTEACQSLLYKKALWVDPEKSLLLSVIARCRRSWLQEETFEDPSE